MNVIVSNKADEILSSLNIDVIKKVQGEFSTDEIVSMFENFFYEKLILDITAIKDYTELKNIQGLSINLDTSKLIILLDGSSLTSSTEYISGLISMGIYNFTKNRDGIIYLMSHPNSYKNVASLQSLDDRPDTMTRADNMGSRVIGFRNLTEHAGSTTLIYMLKRRLEKNYKVSAIEVDKKDFVFFNDKRMVSCTTDDLGQELLRLNSDTDIILIDLNNSNQNRACNEVIYLIEPSIIKVNKLVARNREILKTLEGRKVILNKCLLSPKDISEFEMEAGIKTFYAIPPLNDRISNPAIDNFLVRMGFLKQKEGMNSSNNQGGLFGLFKH